MRLGLVIGEIGDKNKIQVTQDELRRALMEQARRFPGQEKMVYEYYQKNPHALTELRAPIFEDKVVDYHRWAGQAERTRTVSREELLKAIAEDDVERRLIHKENSSRDQMVAAAVLPERGERPIY